MDAYVGMLILFINLLVWFYLLSLASRLVQCIERIAARLEQLPTRRFISAVERIADKFDENSDLDDEMDQEG